jgi:hypothetical protein
MTVYLLKQGDDGRQPPCNRIKSVVEDDFLEVYTADNFPFCIRGWMFEIMSTQQKLQP